MLSVGKSSLVQQKKQQWAREREEMSHLYLPWGGDRYGSTNRLAVRNQFASSLELHKQASYEYQEPPQRQRSPSLPPIRSNDPPADARQGKDTLNRNLPSAKRFAFYDEDGEGDTSGYGSETINHIRRQSSGSHNQVIAWQQKSDDRNGPPSGGRSTGAEDVWSSRSPRSANGEEGRPRWGDRGVATGRLWEPTAPNARLPQMQNQKKGTPSWVERGLNMIENTAEVLVIDQRSSTNSGFECDRSSCNGSDEGRTFLRGQNVPIEPEIKAERETQRTKALELQSAILSQLEDREKQRQEERERKLREERLEELRLQRQLEDDRIKLEEEKRRNQEKQLQEQRKLETLKKALEDAERKAKLEKEKRFVSYRHNSNHSSGDMVTKTDESQEEQKVVVENNEKSSPTKSNRTYDVYSARSQNNKSKDTSHQTTEHNSPRSVSQSNANYTQQNTTQSISLTENHYSIVPIGLNGEIYNGQPNSIQLAVLVPQSLSNSVYSMSLSSLNNINCSPEKILTPRKYRSLRNKDVWTQTDSDIYKTALIESSVETEAAHRDKDYSNIDENQPQDSHNNTKKERRFRSEERFKKELENRPKWGVNRPAAQYKKQSEKDPFYSQKRKMRYKYRTQPRPYTSQSSEDSRSPSPPARPDKLPLDGKQRNSLSQNYWRSKRFSQDLSQPMSLVETTNNVPVQTDIGHLSASELQYSEPKKSPVNNKMTPSKRLTLSQKFINDKYGNRKLWIEDEKNGRSFESDNRKKLIDQMNKAKRDYLERSEDQEIMYAMNKL